MTDYSVAYKIDHIANAVKAQTEVLERIAKALEKIAKNGEPITYDGLGPM